MTEAETLFFDTDCLSTFLWTDQGSLVARLFPQRIVVPSMVHEELLRVGQPLFRRRLEQLLASGDARIRDIDLASSAFPLYVTMTRAPERGFRAVGKGEAAAMALAYDESGIVASNNFKDIAPYIRKLGLRYLATGDILRAAYESGLIDLADGNKLWRHMLEEGCWIGAKSFEDYLAMPYQPLNHF